MANSGLRDINYYFRQSSFAGGEIGEDLWGRADYAKYDVSVSDSTNMYSLPYGGIISRAGTEFIYDLGSSDISVQIIPFQFNVDQQYVMVFTSDGWIYFFTQRGYLTDVDGDIYRVAHTISPSDIGSISYVQSADTMFLTSAQSGVFKLERYGERDFRFSNFVPEAGAFGEWNSTDTYLYTGTYNGTTEHEQTDVSVPYYVNSTSFDQDNASDQKGGGNDSFPYGATTIYSGSAQVGSQDLNATVNWNMFGFTTNANSRSWTSGQSYTSRHGYVGYMRIVVQGLQTRTDGTSSWIDIWSQEKQAESQDGYITRDKHRWTGSANVFIPKDTYTQVRIFAQFNQPDNPYNTNKFFYDRTVNNCTLTIPAWTETWVGTDLNVMCSSTDMFVPSDVGRTIMIAQAVQAHEAHYNGSGTSGALPCKGDWSIIMSGSFNGTITIQRSRDNGLTWENYRSWSMTDLGSFEDSGNIDEFCQLKLIVDRTNDKGIVQLNVDSFIQTVYATITGYVSPTQVNVSYKNVYNKSEYGLVEVMTKQYNYALSAWSQSIGYPRCVTLYQNRLVFASSPSYPLNVWFSAVGDYYNFRVEADSDSDDGAITLTLTSQTMNNINSLISKNDLLGFSEGGVWKINSRSSVTGFTAETAYAQQQNFEGAKNIQPLLVNNHFLYILDLGSTVRDLAYSYSQDSYIGDDVTLLAKHLFMNHEIVSWCYAQEPDSLVYAVRDDGVLLTLTYVKDQEVFAWAKHTTQGKYKAVGSIRGTKASDVYFVIERNGKNYVEVGANRLETDTTRICFMDCSATYQGEEATIISGLDYLEGFKVQILADGSELPEQVVKDGRITLFRPSSYVQIGLGYNKSITSLDLDIPRNDGTGFARKKSVGIVKVQYRDSYGSSVSVDYDNNSHRVFDFLPAKFNEPLELQSGTKEVEVNANWIKEAKITISSDRPVPLNILAIMADIAIGG